MQKLNLIGIKEFCANHNIEISFIHSLHETGLIKVITIKETCFIDVEQLPQLEKIILFYFELNINLEGIESITHLLDRVNLMQAEIIALRNRLRLYENNE